MFNIYIKVVKNIREIILSIQFLTLMPLPHKKEIEQESFGRSMAYYPFVGLLIGSFLFCVYIAIMKYISPLLNAVIITVLWARITGSLHLEGFVDAADGFSAGPDRERILTVMKDPNCGSKGVVALVLLIISKVVILSEIPNVMIFPALLFVPAISRWSMVCGSAFCDYARIKGGLGKPFVENAGVRELFISSVILILAGSILLKLKFIIVIIAPIIFIVIAILYLKRKIGGITGDILGALNELSEVISLLPFLFL